LNINFKINQNGSFECHYRRSTHPFCEATAIERARVEAFDSLTHETTGNTFEKQRFEDQGTDRPTYRLRFRGSKSQAGAISARSINRAIRVKVYIG
jgi:hypothetical protein